MQDPNQKGSVGELAVTLHLVKLGYQVFTSVTKHSKVDLVAISADCKRVIKLQTKTTTSKDGVIKVHTKKTCLNPKYDSNYLPEHADFFAVYVDDLGVVFFVPSHEVLRCVKSITFRCRARPLKRFDVLRNRFYQDYLEL